MTQLIKIILRPCCKQFLSYFDYVVLLFPVLFIILVDVIIFVCSAFLCLYPCLPVGCFWLFIPVCLRPSQFVFLFSFCVCFFFLILVAFFDFMVSCQALFGFYSITLQKEATTHSWRYSLAEQMKKMKYEKNIYIFGGLELEALYSSLLHASKGYIFCHWQNTTKLLTEYMPALWVMDTCKQVRRHLWFNLLEM